MPGTGRACQVAANAIFATASDVPAPIASAEREASGSFTSSPPDTSRPLGKPW
jgi:hypothetical protein